MQQLGTLDANIFIYLFSFSGGKTVNYLIVFFAEYLPYVLLIALVTLIYRSRYSSVKKREILGIVVFASVVSRFGIGSLIHAIYHHPRPFLYFNLYPLFPETSYSFPSGHASFFFALSYTLFLYNRTWGIWFFTATVFMTIARVMAGVHYPSDIIAGMIIAIMVSYIVFKFLSSPLNKWLTMKSP